MTLASFVVQFILVVILGLVGYMENVRDLDDWYLDPSNAIGVSYVIIYPLRYRSSLTDRIVK